ncbi:OmpA family protein [Pseudooceanicola aestuarii]|uniref:OmpA family protein n=1 Tax=Pseudooceanicola aestuarii TaxID=2697319 RepID=UPI0013D55134|nr:OmpA family protein [Pseudooceanicola aestuarii]
MHRTSQIALFVAALALAGCGPSSHREAGAELDSGYFGNSQMHNHQVMTGQYLHQLGTRFAQEVDTTVTFAFNSAVLDAQAQTVLAQQAQWIRQFPEVRFRVYGHTDAVGTNAYNKRLGLRRAQAVVSFFATRGISRSRLEAVVSYGETQPVIPVPGPERQNRRTVTEVLAFVDGHKNVLDGKYAQIIYRDYVQSAQSATQLSGAEVGATGE